MAVKIEEFFPSWVASNFAVFPPAFLFHAIIFCFGLLFEIDPKLVAVLSFGDYLLYFTLFLFFFGIVVIGLALPARFVWRKLRVGALFLWLLKSQRNLLWLNGLLIVLLGAEFFAPEAAKVWLSVAVGLVIVLMFLIPMILAYGNADVVRFRWSMVAMLIALAFPFNSLGSLIGKTVLSSSDRVYFLRLQSGVDEYINVLLYTSTGIIYRADGSVRFTPYDAVAFTRRMDRIMKM